MSMHGWPTPFGKQEVKEFINKQNLGRYVLDVGAGSGTYRILFNDNYFIMDAVEIWHESVEFLKSIGYRTIYEQNIVDFEYQQDYDLIILGDVIEHLTVEDAQSVIDKAKEHCKHILIAVPYTLPQGSLYGNNAEIHIQDDLRPELFNERYPGFNRIVWTEDIHYWNGGYAYYYI